MATLSVTFDFLTDIQSFVGTPGANSTTAYNAFSGNPAGCLEYTLSGKSHTNANKFARTLTYEDMGVPAGSTITGITSASVQSKCWSFLTSSSSTSGPVNLLDGATTIILSNSRTYTAQESVWTTTNGTDHSGMSSASNTSVTITFNATMITGNSTSAQNGLDHDTLTFTITYTPPAAATYIPPRRPATTLVNRIVIF